MDSTKLIALLAAGSSSSSMVSGSLFSGNSSLSVPVKMENPFANFEDLSCLKSTFSGIEDTELVQAKKKLQDKTTPSSTFTLASPTTPDASTVGGCYKVVYHHIPGWTQIIGATLEMAVTKGNYGLALLNVMANMKNYGGKTFLYRALFLEKSDKWRIKAGVQWSDEAFLKNAQNTDRLVLDDKITTTANKKEIVWSVDPTDKYSYDDLVTKANHTDKFSWKPEGTSSNIYQDLTIKPKKPDGSGIQDFWNGKEEPIEANSTISKPIALLDTGEKIWKKATEGIDVAAIKAWFNLFKEDKGKWAK